MNDAIELLNHACSDGDGNGGGYEPTLWDRRRAIIEAAARLAEAKADLAAVRRALDVLVPVVGAAAALVEVQTRLAEPPS